MNWFCEIKNKHKIYIYNKRMSKKNVKYILHISIPNYSASISQYIPIYPPSVPNFH
jgi:hypothetical protein